MPAEASGRSARAANHSVVRMQSAEGCAQQSFTDVDMQKGDVALLQYLKVVCVWAGCYFEECEDASARPPQQQVLVAWLPLRM